MEQVVELMTGGFKVVQVAIGRAELLLAKVFDRGGELFDVSVRSHDRSCIAASICPQHPEFVANDQVLNE